MNDIKIHGWDAVQASQSDLYPGEDNAAIISFRIANIKGLSYFIKAFQGIKNTLANKENFSSINFVMMLAQAGSSIYLALKEAKNK